MTKKHVTELLVISSTSWMFYTNPRFR